MRIAIVGLGYVGLPLALALSKHYSILGFDINPVRIEELRRGYDRTHESDQQLSEKTSMIDFTTELEHCEVYLVTVPTPVDKENSPDLEPLIKASEMIGKVLQIGDVVCYESTVYPGVTELECGKTLQRISGLRSGTDFFLGYSPERINTGDSHHQLTQVVKVIAGQTSETIQLLAEIYGSITKIYRAPSIRVAEMCKVMENAQRDINIAFMNEMSQIAHEFGISIYDVLRAAETKWNFLRFRPGLVGGHCIGIDSYYLVEGALHYGCKLPSLMQKTRKINEEMSSWVAKIISEELCLDDQRIKRIHVLGLTFKENVTDLRNSKVVDLIHELTEMGYQVTASDCRAHPAELAQLDVILENPQGPYDLVVLAVPHQEYGQMDLMPLLGEDGRLFDLTNYLVKFDPTRRIVL